jgi:acyl-CoA reductase-like NAD-dependent aldehyde dehydrogenase
MFVTPLKEAATFLKRRPTLLINNDWVAGSGGTLDVLNPATEEKIATIVDASTADVERAVTAAPTAFDSGEWGNDSPYGLFARA